MKLLRYSAIVMLGGLVIFVSCKKSFINYTPQGVLSASTLTNAAGVNALLVGAYASLSGQGNGASLDGNSQWATSPDNWIYGSVVAGDAHKGSDAGDQPPIYTLATFETDPTVSFLNSKWICDYEGITRANTVIKLANLAPDLTGAARTNVIAQAHFLRGHFYFDLKKMFNMVPYITDTTVDYDQPNTTDIWPDIEADFTWAYDSLPQTQTSAGMANKWAAGAYLGKTYLYEAKWTEAQPVLDNVVANGVTSTGTHYGLPVNFETNWLPQDELTDSEAVFQVEMAANVGNGNISEANQGDMLNFPYGNSPFGCCGFFQPTIDLVNSYRTDANGLPYVTTYNQHPVVNDMNVPSTTPFTTDPGPLDPRLEWTVGRRGVAYLDWGPHPGAAWVRDQSYSGPYAPKKNLYWKATQSTYHDGDSWAPGSSININIIRFADVLLMDAEAHAENNDLAGATTLVNLVRARAANTPVNGNNDNILSASAVTSTPAAFTAAQATLTAIGSYIVRTDVNQTVVLINLNGTTPVWNTYTAPTYHVGLYPTFPSQTVALQDIYFERKLELAMEGQRFFDISRWGIAGPTMTAFFAYEGQYTVDIQGASFTSPKNNYYPIPQGQIDLTTLNGKATLTQNPGY